MKTLENNTPRIRVMDAVLLVLSGFLALALKTFMGPCTHADGTVAACATAGTVCMMQALLLFLEAGLRLFVRRGGIKAGLSMAMVPTALLSAYLLGNVTGLCMMADMHCRRLMQPGNLVLCVLLCVLALTDTLVLMHKKPHA